MNIPKREAKPLNRSRADAREYPQPNTGTGILRPEERRLKLARVITANRNRGRRVRLEIICFEVVFRSTRRPKESPAAQL